MEEELDDYTYNGNQDHDALVDYDYYMHTGELREYFDEGYDDETEKEPYDKDEE